jgi:Tfp pilus assembly protein PilF
MSKIETFESMLAKGQDSAMLRFSLGNAYFEAGDHKKAVEHLRSAVAQDPKYSAAWKMLGKAVEQTGDSNEAISVFKQGIAVAEEKGDMQAVKEMNVFLKRLRKKQAET